MSTLQQTQGRVLVSQSLIDNIFDDSNFEEIVELNFDDPSKIDYKVYLEHSLEVLNKKSLESGGKSITVTAEEILEEIPVWRLPNFVWPFLLHNHEGEIILLWSMSGIIIRWERIRKGLYCGEMFSKKAIMEATEPKSVRAPKFVREFIEVYHDLSKLAFEKNIDWKNQLVNNLAKL